MVVLKRCIAYYIKLPGCSKALNKKSYLISGMDLYLTQVLKTKPMKPVAPFMVITFLCLWSGLLLGQGDYFFHKFTVNDGLPSSSVNAIDEDHLGNIWIGTNNGLCKYDGQKFERIRENEDGLPILSGNYITALSWINDSILAVGTYENGLNLLNVHSMRSEVFKGESPTAKRIADNRIMFLKTDSNQHLWIGLHKNGLHFFNEKNREIEAFHLHYHSTDSDPNSGSFREMKFHTADSNFFFLSGTGGFYLVDKRNGETLNLLPDKSLFPQLNWAGNSLVQLTDSTLFAGLWGGGIFYKNLYSGQWDQFLPDPSLPLDGGRNIISSIVKRDEKSWWISTHDQGILILDNSGNFNRPTRKQEEINYMIESGYSTIFRDSKDRIWIGGTQGLKLRKENDQYFDFFPLSVSVESKWRRLFRVLQILADKHREAYYFGTWVGSGLYHFDLETKTESIFPIGDQPNGVVTINGLVYNSKGEIFVGTLDDGLHLFFPENKSSKKIDNPLDYPLRIRALEKYGGELIIACANNGIVLYNEDRGSWTVAYGLIRDENNAPMELITDLAVDAQGWVATSGNRGAILFHSQDLEIRHLGPEQAYPIDFRMINCVHFDQNNHLWLGTQSKGVFRLDEEFKIAENFTEIQGINNNFINDLTSDEQGLIYISSLTGINILNPKTREIFSYQQSNGLSGESINRIFIDELRQKAILGDKLGFLTADIQNLITPIDCSNGRLSVFPIPYKATQKKGGVKIKHFKPYQNTLTFSFNDYTFRSADQLRYRYRLLGWSEEYNYTTIGQFSRTYDLLPAGKYTFEVSSLCNNGIYASVGLPMEFVIEKAVYDKTWFRAGGILLLCSLPLFIIGTRVQRKREKLNFEKRLSELKMESLRAQMNPHFIFNSLNSIRYYIQSQDNKSAVKYLNKFGHLIRLILDYTRSQAVSLEQEVEVIKLYLDLEEIRFGGKFSYQLTIAEDVDLSYVHLPPLLSQPYVENAIWHGIMHKEGKGSLSYSIKKESDSICIYIQDDGVGRNFFREKEKQQKIHSSHGLKITHERVEEFNKLYDQKIHIVINDLFTNGNEPCGTEVIIKIKDTL